ncbi:MAG: hypothetical protein GY739_11305 [Mesoflavibacter sp.]|nr:hypothetical protein [Mesoflavibacter sp.]
MKILKILPYIVIVVASIFIYDLYFENKSFKTQISDLNDELKENGIIITKNDETILNLKKDVKKAKTNYYYIYNKLKDFQNETDSIVDDVYGYDVYQLDSIITNHRHIKRPKI